MRRFLALGAAALFSLVVASGAGGSDNQFAVGSAKTDTEVIFDLQRASFSAHNTGVGCEAKGQVHYDDPFGGFVVKIHRLVVAPSPTGRGGSAYFAGVVTKVDEDEDPVILGKWARFQATDAGFGGGEGDTFAFFGLAPVDPGCEPPSSAGYPITSGNIVIKATGPMLLP